MRSFVAGISEHRISVAYCVTFLLAICIVFFDYIFGSKIFVFVDVGSDTCNQYFAFYTYLADALADGDLSIWNFNYGMGVDFFAMQSWVMDPFAWLIVLPGFLFGIDAIRCSVLIVHIIKIGLLVALFDKYLKYFDVSASSRVLYSILFGFNGFMMLWGQHYFLGTAMVYQIALLCVIEWSLREQTWKSLAVLSLVVFLIAVFSVYVCYMMMLFAVCYVLFRLAYDLPRFSMPLFFKRLYPLVISAIIGICLSGFALIPTAINLLTSSGRFEASVPLLERCANAFWDVRSGGGWLVLTRFLSNNLVIDANVDADISTLGPVNYYEFPEIAVTFAFFMLLPQFYVWLFREEKSPRRRILVVVASVLIAAYFVNGLLALTLNAFVAVAYRSTFVFLPLLLLACALAWDKVIVRKTTNRGALVVGTLITVSVLAAAIWYCRARGLTVPLLVGLAMLLGAVVVFALILVANKARSEKTLRSCLVGAACILLLASMFDGYITNCHRDTWTNDLDFLQEGTYGVDTMQAIDYIKDSDDAFYRIEKTYSDVSYYSDSLYQDYRGITGYDSTLLPGLSRFYREFWPEVSTANGVYQTYLDAPDNAEAATLLGIKYLVSHDELDFEWLEEIETPASCYVYRNVLANSIGTKVYKALSSEQYQTSFVKGDMLLDDYVIFDNAELPEGEFGSETPPTSEERSSIRFSNDDLFYAESDAVVRGSCSMPSDGYLVLAIPAKSGWSIAVDGQEARVLKGDYGLCTVKLSAGNHDIEARYSIVGFEYGLAVSLAGLVGFIVWVALRMRRDHTAATPRP